MRAGQAALAAWLAAGMHACLAQPQSAGATTESLELSGSVRAGLWSSSRELDDDRDLAPAALWLKAGARVSESLRLQGEGYVSRQDMASRRPDNSRSVLREAYADAVRDALDLRIGKQIIAWGRADRFNPTDNLTPRDFTLLVADDDDQRIGAAAIKADYRAGTLTYTAAWLARFDSNTVPLGRLPPGVSLARVPVAGEHRQVAFKIDQTGSAIDWSLSYFNGFDLNPDVSPLALGAAGGTLALRNNRIRVLGFDAASAIGRTGLRAETAYIRTEDREGRNPFVKNANLYTVLGAERVFGESLSVTAQYLTRLVERFHGAEEIADPALRELALVQAALSNQLDRTNRAVAWRVSRRWLHQTLDTEASAVYSIGRHDYALRLKLRYAIDDQWSIAGGGDRFRGRAHTTYGRLRDNSAAYVQLKYSF
jgi:hypothetical protein